MDPLDRAFAQLGWNSKEAEDYVKTVKLRHEVIPRQLELITHVTAVLQPKMILEVGSWLGASTISWIRNSTNDTKIISLDTWLGSLEHIMDQFPNDEWGRVVLDMRLGRPNFYDQFLKVISEEKLLENVYPLNATSLAGMKFLNRLGSKFDVIYIDGSHELVDVYLDLVSSVPLLQMQDKKTVGGVLCGDDFLWPDVATAVKMLAKSGSMTVFFKNNSWAITEFLDLETKLNLEKLFKANGWSNLNPSEMKQEELNSLLIMDKLVSIEQIKLALKNRNEFETSLLNPIYKVYLKLRKLKHAFLRLNGQVQKRKKKI